MYIVWLLKLILAYQAVCATYARPFLRPSKGKGTGSNQTNYRNFFILKEGHSVSVAIPNDGLKAVKPAMT